ncbi:MAG: peptidoglycan-binding protein [Planctomycetales bacterium]|nr:peptidoglycan-binding protein [Planctomycetales bacterium]
MVFSATRFQGDPRLEQLTTNSPVMKKGEVGYAVRLIQQALIDLHYPMPKTIEKHGTPDGIFGSETKSAVYDFQVKEKLKDKDGIVGKDTIAKLDTKIAGVPWSILPPLPIDTPVDWAVEMIIETLNSSLLGGLTYVVDGVRIESKKFREIADAIEEGRINVFVDPSIGGALEYEPGDSAFKFSTAPKATIYHRASIVHEAVHAVCDLRGHSMDYILSEMLAFIGGSYYFRRVTAKRREFPGQPETDAVYRTADNIAHKMAHGELITQADLNELRSALTAPNSGYAHNAGNIVAYDGIAA